jgi:hypothetical protein
LNRGLKEYTVLKIYEAVSKVLLKQLKCFLFAGGEMDRVHERSILIAIGLSVETLNQVQGDVALARQFCIGPRHQQGNMTN